MSTYFIFFIAGAILHSLLSRALGILRASIAYHDLEVQILSLLLSLEGDMDSALRLKAENLKSAGVERDEVDEVLDADREIVEAWKEIVLFKMMSSFPKGFWKLFKYETWPQARLYVESLNKEE